MTVVLTGGCGLVGANLARAVLDRSPNTRVVVFDLSQPDEIVREFLRPHQERAVFIQCDVASAADLTRAAAAIDLGEVQTVVHAAMVAHVPRWEADSPRRYLDVNIGGTVNVLEWARSLPALKRFVYVSTGDVYGDVVSAGADDSLQLEDAVSHPRELYAISKHSSELIVRRYGELFGIDVRQVRLSTVFGQNERPTPGRLLMSAANAVVRAALTDRPLRITARTLHAVADYLSAEDVADGICRLVDVGHPRYPVYNLALGRLVSFPELVDAAARAGATATVEVTSDETAELDLDPALRLARWGAYDIERARSDLGWVPRSMVEQLRSYVSWARVDPQQRL